MKKIFALSILALLLAACNMDFYSSDSMTSSQLAENPSSAVYTTDGIYSLFKDRIAYKGQSGGESGNYYIRHYFQLSELRGDNVTVSGKSEDPFTDAYMYAEDPTTKNIYYTWWMAYKIINAANSNIEAIEPGATALSDHLLGENYFFRAIAHFHLVTLFAMPYAQGRDNPGVVLRQGLDISTTSRATVGEIYDAVVNDLIEAKKFLAIGEKERVSGSEKCYVTLDAATALLARVYLYMDKNDECIKECDELMAHAPSAVTSGYDYADYPTHTYNHPETIWCIRLDENDDWAGEHAEASIASMYIKDGNGWGEHYMNDNLFDMFRRYPEDKRFEAYIHMPEHPEGIPVVKPGDKVAVVLPIKVNETTKARSDGFAVGCTMNDDGSVDFKYDGKSYKAVPETVNTYTEYYVNASGFPGEKIDGKARVFIRPDFTRSKGVRNNMGGDYTIYYCSKFSYQDGLPMMTSPVFLRWGEVVLNRAEAYAKKGQDAKALEDVNTIRKRAGLSGDALMTAANIKERGYKDVLDCVLAERRLELCYEGHRMFDVFRNKLPMDRRFVGCHDWEVMQPNDKRIALLIPLDEINSSGIPQNER
ncbi:MAG: RagB/SusD family nutrient uptake outer membrane protein [Bacteroidales bacterium]|nr:RagB/SusD family nutrient uptake outer membrane protein [Bacteroidales bacterium]MBO4565652.1 RagB/SusD family nutrient uptake outer membrane protein [Bacteroidales bacterium]